MVSDDEMRLKIGRNQTLETSPLHPFSGYSQQSCNGYYITNIRLTIYLSIGRAICHFIMPDHAIRQALSDNRQQQGQKH